MIRTRIAPSPTGLDLHVGSVATALVNFAWAKKHKGQFVVRIEDTDRTRLVPGAEKKILSTLDLIGLSPDESPKLGGPYGPYRQSERLVLYEKYALELIKKNKAYFCTCTPERLEKMRKKQQSENIMPKYDRLCRDKKYQISDIKNKKYVIRLKVPDNKVIVVHDLVRGEIKFNTNDIDDQIVLKSDGFPTYHLGVVVDDHLMKITDVIRGEEWLPSTPKHILLYQAFGWPLPKYAHISLLRNPDKSKLSKRKNPVWTSWYIEQGILPEALLNYLALMGWSHPDGREIFSLMEYIKVFDIKDVQKTAPIFDPVKLEWMNGEYIRKTQSSKLKAQIGEFYKNKLPEKIIEQTIPLVKERIKKLSDYLPLAEFFFKAPEKYEIDLSNKKEFFKNVYQNLKDLDSWKADTIGDKMQKLAKNLEVKNSQFFMDLRVAITGRKISPPLNESMEVLGKTESVNRIKSLTG